MTSETWKKGSVVNEIKLLPAAPFLCRVWESDDINILLFITENRNNKCFINRMINIFCEIV